MSNIKVSLKKPLEHEVVNGVAYTRKNITQVYNTNVGFSHWEYEEEEENTGERKQQILDQMAELQQELNSLGG